MGAGLPTQGLQPTFTYLPDGLHWLQTMQTVRKLRRRRFRPRHCDPPARYAAA
jgi:hypothetical protein